MGKWPVTIRRSRIASCSFCGKPNTVVERLVAGPGVYICNECVVLSQRIIDAKSASVLHVAPWLQVSIVDAVLENLPRIARAGS